MAPSTPQSGSAMSSRLLSMKFMQRAAASSAAPSPASASDGGSAKRRKLNSGSTGASPAAGAPVDDPFSQVHVKAALEELEAKRRAAVERRAAELSDSHWVLDVPAMPARGGKGSAGKPPLNIVYVGYGDIDRAEGNDDSGGDGEEGDAEYEETQDKVQAGRRITGNYKKKDAKEKNQGSKSDSSNSDSSDEEGEISGSSDEEDSRSRNVSRGRKGAGSAKAGSTQPGKAKKDVKLSRLTSISGAGNTTAPQGFGPKTLECFACGEIGHRAVDPECPKNRNRNSRKRRAN